MAMIVQPSADGPAAWKICPSGRLPSLARRRVGADGLRGYSRVTPEPSASYPLLEDAEARGAYWTLENGQSDRATDSLPGGEVVGVSLQVRAVLVARHLSRP